MDIIQRGNTSLLKSIHQGARKVSQSNGVAESSIMPTQQTSIPETGAYATMMRSMQKVSQPTPRNIVHVVESTTVKKLEERLMESVETLGVTKEYFNATSSLFTLHTMGKLTEGVLDSISREDLREIKSIIREFKSVIDSY